MSMITAASWVPRGFAAPLPAKYELDESELKRIEELAKLRLEDATEDLEEAQANAKNGDSDDDEKEAHPNGGASRSKKTKAKMEIDIDDDDLKEYDLEHYDDSDENDEPEQSIPSTMAMFGHNQSLTYYESNADDPYITLGANPEEDEEREDLQILATDNLVLATKVEDDMAQLEVYVYEDDADNLYVHHDIMLPAIPLCVEWLDFAVNREQSGSSKDAAANFVAVGTMDPEIEIWDLDTVDAMYPNAILGQAEGDKKSEKKTKKKKKSKSSKANDSHHVDSVLALAANRKHRNLLASASADKTIKLWDLSTTQCAKSYSYHTDKVCSVAWHAAESTVLLSGSYDRTVVVADMRAPDASSRPRWGVESDIETVRWDPHDQNYFLASTEAGMVHYFDVRAAPSSPAATKAVWTLQAHDEAVNAFDVNPVIPGFMATGSVDRTVKLWNYSSGSGPSMVVSRNLDVGKIFAATFAPDAEVAFRLAVAGSKGTMHVWDTSTNAAVRKAFADRVPERTAGAEERLVGVLDDEEEAGSDEEEEDDSEDSEGGGGAALGRRGGDGDDSMDED